jgi:hypothetical protein
METIEGAKYCMEINRRYSKGWLERAKGGAVHSPDESVRVMTMLRQRFDFSSDSEKPRVGREPSVRLSVPLDSSAA